MNFLTKLFLHYLPKKYPFTNLGHKNHFTNYFTQNILILYLFLYFTIKMKKVQNIYSNKYLIAFILRLSPLTTKQYKIIKYFKQKYIDIIH